MSKKPAVEEPPKEEVKEPRKELDQDISTKLKSKAKTEKEKDSVKPTVINDSLIKAYMIQYNRENEIYERNDEPLWKMEHLALSYKNIIGISNLGCMNLLTKL